MLSPFPADSLLYSLKNCAASPIISGHLSSMSNFNENKLQKIFKKKGCYHIKRAMFYDSTLPLVGCTSQSRIGMDGLRTAICHSKSPAIVAMKSTCCSTPRFRQYFRPSLIKSYQNTIFARSFELDSFTAMISCSRYRIYALSNFTISYHTSPFLCFNLLIIL